MADATEINMLTENWRKLAFQMMPSQGAYAGGFSTTQMMDYLAGRQMPYSGGPSNDAQWLRQISLIVYGGASGQATGTQGTDYGGGGDKPAQQRFLASVPINNEELRRRMLGRQLRLLRPTPLDEVPSTELDDVQVTAEAPQQSSTPQDGSGLELGMLRVTFNVHKRTQSTPDLFEARIYNLSPETRDKIIQFGRVQLSVGYRFANFGKVFDGTVVQYRHGKENAVDTYLDIIAGDGDNLNSATSFRRIDKGTTEKDAINLLIKDTGFPLGHMSDNVGSQTLVRPWVIAGSTQQYIRQMALKYGCEFWVDQGQVYMVKQQEYLPGEAVVLSPTTGLVNIPQDTPNGIQCQCLINPKIKLGGRIKLDNKLIAGVAFQPGGQPMTADTSAQSAARYGADIEIPQATSPTGDYKIVMMEITGDTRGKPWYMDLICVGLDNNNQVIPQTSQSAWNRSWVANEQNAG